MLKPFKAAVCVLACLGLGLLSTARAEDIVVTHYGSQLYGVPYAIALEKGYFKEAGVDVSGILTSKGGGTSVRNMIAGDTLIAEVALPAALSAIKEGFKIKILSGGTDGSGAFWVTRSDEMIDKPADLKGKRFVYSRPKSVTESVIIAILKSFKMTPADVKMIAIGDFSAGITALEHNKVDIAVLPEPQYSLKEKEGSKYKILSWLDQGVPALTQTVTITTDEVLASRPDKLRAVIEARRKGVEFLYANPKEAGEILAKAYDLPVDVATSAIVNVVKQNPDFWNRGELKMPLMEAMAEALGSVGGLDLPVDWKAVIQPGFEPKAMGQ